MDVLNKPSIYIDLHPLFTYNAPLTIVGGGRGRGKTFSMKKMLINFNQESIWLNRTKEKSIEVAKGFMKDLIEVYPKYEDRFELTWVTYKEDTISEKKQKVKYVYPVLVEKATQKPRVHFTSLNVSNKGIPFPRIRNLVFDEFMVKPGTAERYLTDEITTFLDVYQTIARLRKDFRCIMIGNEIDDFNPYFAYWGISGFDKSREFTWFRKPDILMQWVKDKEEFIAEYEQSAFGRIVRGTNYDDYMRGKSALLTYDIRMKKVPDYATYEFNLLHNGNYLSVYKALGMLYVSSTMIDTKRVSYVPNLREAGNRRYYDKAIIPMFKEILGKGGIFVTDKRARTWLLEWLNV